MKILFAASEASPFIKTGGLGDVGGALPKALSESGHDVRVFLPLYGRIKYNDELKKKLTFVTDFLTPLGWRNQYTGIFKYEAGENLPTYYFIDNEYYFARYGEQSIYGNYDDGEKFGFFSKAVIEALAHIDLVPDVIHCNDWQTALIPVFLRKFYPHYNGVRTVFTIHNIEYQGKMPPDFAKEILGLDDEGTNTLFYGDCVNFMKGAIVKSDAVTTVSESYAGEIQSEFFSHGLHYVLRDNSHKLYGIVNGIDPDSFDPLKDKNLALNYSWRSFDRKKKNKLALQEELGLTPDPDVPLAVMVTRLVNHKGLDLVERVLDEIADGVQLAVVGTGDHHYEELFRNAANRRRGRIAAYIAFDPSLASRMYAGADMFIMPSLSEPCGLSQLIAMRYGTIPVVRETGGLRDTVPAYNPETGEGVGFTFVDYNAHELLYAVRRCTDMYYNDKENFVKLAKRNMKADVSWSASVRKYEDIYNKLVR